MGRAPIANIVALGATRGLDGLVLGTGPDLLKDIPEGIVVQDSADAAVDVGPHVVDGTGGRALASALGLFKARHDGKWAAYGFNDLKKMDVDGVARKSDSAVGSTHGLDEACSLEEDGDRRDKERGYFLRLSNFSKGTRMFGIGKKSEIEQNPGGVFCTGRSLFLHCMHNSPML